MTDHKPSWRDKLIFGTQFLEVPWLVEQVKYHLVFGFLVRHVSIGKIFVVIGGIYYVISVLLYKGTLGGLVDEIVGGGIGLVVLVFISLLPRLRQAIVFWIISKLVIGVLCLILIFVGFPTILGQGHWDAWILLALGLIWLPSLEFINGLRQLQKRITVTRLILSIPLIYLGIMSGNWHW